MDIAGWLETFAQDVRFGLRMLRKNPGFATVAVLTLALGIGANTAIFSVVKAVLLNALPYRQPRELMQMAAGGPRDKNPSTVSYDLVQDWKERSHSFESIAVFGNWAPTITGDFHPEIIRGAKITYDFFGTLGIRMAMGRDFEAADDRPDRRQVVLVSYDFWKSHFGGAPDVVGRTITLSQLSYEVIGILPQNFEPLSFRFGAAAPQIWAPLGYRPTDAGACRACRGLRAVARLKPGTSAEQAQAELDGIMPRLVHDYSDSYPTGFRAVVTPLESAVAGKQRSALWMLLGATSFVLLIACANLTSLLLARAKARHRELSVRLALGCQTSRLLRQILTETTVLTLAGGVAGLVAAPFLLRIFVHWAPVDTPRLADIRVDSGVLIFALIVSFLTGQIAGLMPAVAAVRTDQKESLQLATRGGTTGIRRGVRTTLIVCEVAFAFVLTLGTGLFLRSFAKVLAVDPGLEAAGCFTTNVGLVGPAYGQPGRAAEFEREMLERLRALPGVSAAGIVSTLPLGGSHDRRGIQIQDRPVAVAAAVPLVDSYFVSSGYLEAIVIPLKRGRLFADADLAPNAPAVAIVSEATARQLWPQKDAIGEHIELGVRNEAGPWAEIVGVVGDVRQYGLESEATPEAYLTYTQAPQAVTFPTIVMRSNVAAETLEEGVEREVAALDKNIPVFLPATMNEVISDSVAQRRFLTRLVGCFGVLALLLSCLGVYGMMAYQVSKRSEEIGLRMAIGASRWAVQKMVLREGMGAVACGIALGAIIGLACARVIASQLYGVQATDVATLAGATLVIGAVAFLACYFPARNAATIDPLVALRNS